MGYKECLEFAGAKVICMEEFGDYQGSWMAKVEYNGKVSWVLGSFGSCSGCDSFLGEFDFNNHEFNGAEHDEKSPVEGCPKCDEVKKRMAGLGMTYLTDLRTQEEIEAYCNKHLEWDSEAQEMLDWVKQNKI